MSEANLKVILTKPPTYLQEFLDVNEEIYLIYRSLHQNHKNSPKNEIGDNTIVENNELDLTGNPLAIDLNNTISNNFELTYFSKRPPNWTNEETKQLPVQIKDARNFLNKQLRLGSKKGLFCLVNQTNNILIGVSHFNNQLNRYLLNVIGYLPENQITMEWMKIEHLKENNAKCEIVKTEQEIRKLYYLHEYDYKKCLNFKNLENNGSIAIEVYEKMDQKVLKMNLQILLGHEISEMYKFWSDFLQILKFYDILNDPDERNNEETLIKAEQTENINFDNIEEEIESLFTTKNLSKDNQTNFNLENVRNETIQDKFWKILIKYCKNLSELREVFLRFFEKLAECEISTNLEETTMFSVIVNGISNGKLSVPIMNFEQSLEFLLEIGLEKFKLDFYAIIKHFYNAIDSCLLEKIWWGFSEKSELNEKLKQRNTRFSSINLKIKQINFDSLNKKLNFLFQLYKMIEFMFLIKQCNLQLNDENYHYFNKNLFNEFMCKGNFKNSINLENTLCEFSVNLIETNLDVLQNKSPDLFVVKFTSNYSNSTISTTFLLSEYQTFPNSIYDNYDISNTNLNDKYFYVSKMVKYVENV